MWFGRHVLAAAANVATPRCLEEIAPCPVGGTGPRRADRLVQGRGGQPEPAGRFWGRLTGKNPTDRAKKGTKRHLLVDGQGTPLAVRITGAQRHDSLEALPLLDAIPPLPQPNDHKRRRPKSLYGDAAYGTPRNHQGLKRRHIEDHLSQPRRPHGSGLGKIRWVVERTLAWVGQARRLKSRYDKLAAVHRAFHYLQMARMCCLVIQDDF